MWNGGWLSVALLPWPVGRPVLSLLATSKEIDLHISNLREGGREREGELLHLRATSHTRLKARDHCNLRALIGRKYGDHPSLLHTQRWRFKGSKKISWMKSLHGVIHSKLWIRFHGLPNFSSSPPPKDEPNANSRRPWFFEYFFF